MSTTAINVLGYTGRNKQFIVKTLTADLRINQSKEYPEPEGPNPYEYLLAGVAGCINALGQQIALELGIVLKSLQVEITGKLDTANNKNKRQGFTRITVFLKPTTTASLLTLQKWIAGIEQRDPVYRSLISDTSLDLILYKEYRDN